MDDAVANLNALTERIIGAAITVHRALGPGLLESVYQRCLALELKALGVSAVTEVYIPVTFRGETIENAYKIDIVAEGSVVVELKAVEKILPVHEAQLLTYLRLSKLRVGLLLNFNAPVMKDGITRRIL